MRRAGAEFTGGGGRGLDAAEVEKETKETMHSLHESVLSRVARDHP